MIPGMIKMYHFEIEETDDGLAYASRLEQLQQLVIDGEIGKAKILECIRDGCYYL